MWSCVCLVLFCFVLSRVFFCWCGFGSGFGVLRALVEFFVSVNCFSFVVAVEVVSVVVFVVFVVMVFVLKVHAKPGVASLN